MKTKPFVRGHYIQGESGKKHKVYMHVEGVTVEVKQFKSRKKAQKLAKKVYISKEESLKKGSK